MKYAIAIREFCRVLFGSRYVAQLQDDIEEARKERDWFKGKADRLELMLLPNRNPLAANQTKANPAPRQTGRVSSQEAMRIHMANEFAEPEKSEEKTQ